MRRIIAAAALAAGIFAAPLPAPAAPQPMPANATAEVAFGPGRAAPDLIARAIDDATHEIRVGSYQMTNGIIINALRRAAARGVDVRMVIDGETCEAARFIPVRAVLVAAGIAFRCDHRHPIHHNKVAIIDGAVVITGSFNFSPSAMRNAENVIVLRGVPALAAAYLSNWTEHWEHASP